MSQLNICLKCPAASLIDYSVLIKYYEQLNYEDAKRQFLDTLPLFWQPLKAWYEKEKRAEMVIETARQEILSHRQRILSKWEKKLLNPSASYPFPAQRFNLARPVTSSMAKRWKFRLQPRKTTPIGTLLIYLQKDVSLYSDEQKYWRPNLAWWGALASEQIGVDKDTEQAISFYCASLLQDHANLLKEASLSIKLSTTETQSIAINSNRGGYESHLESQKTRSLDPNQHSQVQSLLSGLGEFV